MRVQPTAWRLPDEDAERFRRMTPEARLQLFLELCDLTDSIVNARPNSDALRAATPRTPSAEALWQRLMRRRNGR